MSAPVNPEDCTCVWSESANGEWVCWEWICDDRWLPSTGAVIVLYIIFAVIATALILIGVTLVRLAKIQRRRARRRARIIRPASGREVI